MVTNCPLFYSDKEEPEVLEVPPSPEVVEVLPLPEVVEVPPPQQRRKEGQWHPAWE